MVMSKTNNDYQDSGYPIIASLGGDNKDVPQNKKHKTQHTCDVCRCKKVINHLGCQFYHLTPTHPPVVPQHEKLSLALQLGWVATLLWLPWET